MVPCGRNVRRGRRAVVASLVTAYLRGMQGCDARAGERRVHDEALPRRRATARRRGVAFPYGREQVYPGGNFDSTSSRSRLRIEAGTGAGDAVLRHARRDLDQEEVGFGFNHGVITGLLRDRYGFDGVVCSDWGCSTRDGERCGPARAWGVEHLSTEGAGAEGARRGCADQFGGRTANSVVDLVRSGRIDEARIDSSVRGKGCYATSSGSVSSTTRTSDARLPPTSSARRSLDRGHKAQTLSFVLLKNDGDVLPLRGNPRCTSRDSTVPRCPALSASRARRRDADVALVRVQAPCEPRQRQLHRGPLHRAISACTCDIAWLFELIRKRYRRSSTSTSTAPQ